MRYRRTTRVGPVLLTLAAGALLAPPAAADIPDSNSYPDLTVTASCMQGRTGVVSRYVTDGRPARLTFADDVYTTVAAKPGTPVAVTTDLPVGPGTTVLLDFSNRALGTRSFDVSRCDGWTSRSDYLASTSALPGAPQALPSLPDIPMRAADGSRTYRGPGGSLVIDRAGTGHVVRGAIDDRWQALGAQRSVLGGPVTSECQLSTYDGYYTTFRAGVVYWKPGPSAHVLRGALLQGYAARDYERSGMGIPVTDEFGPLRRGGFGQHFENASLYWSPAAGAHRVQGAIRNAWAAQGWETGSLGYPATDEFRSTGGTIRQNFQGGSLIYDPSADRVVRV